MLFRGCVTPSILVQLGALNNLDSINGFKDLQTADKSKVRTAIANKKVAEEDIPPTARNVSVSHLDNIAPANSKKRRAQEDTSSGSKARISPPSHSQSHLDNITPANIKKRKAQEDTSSGSKARIPPPSHSQPPLFDVEDDEVDSSEEARDELYCTLDTNVVGLQYYSGMSSVFSFCTVHISSAGLVGPGEEVILQREPGNNHDA